MFLRVFMLHAVVSAASWGHVVEPPVTPERFASPGHAVEGFHLRQASNRALWVTGLSAMAASTGASLFVLFTTGDALSVIPLAGPFLYAARRVLGITSVRYTDRIETFATVASIISGLTQVIGAAMLVIGLTNPRVRLERDAPPQVSLAFSATGAQVRVTF